MTRPIPGQLVRVDWVDIQTGLGTRTGAEGPRQVASVKARALS